MTIDSVVSLREVEPDDLPIFFEHQRDPEAARMAAFPSRQHDAFTAHWTRILQDEGVLIRTILVDGQVAGNIVSFMHEGKREVGYWIGREYWGQGVASRALAAFLGHDLSRPLFAGVYQDNTASIRVLEKCGFIQVGREGVEVVLRLDGDQA
jgi:RimJ/RimL family protein N-acetyltransferase